MSTTDPQLDMFASLIKGKSDEEIYAAVSAFGGVEPIADGIINGMLGQLNPALAQDTVMGYRITTPDGAYPYRIEVTRAPATAVMTKVEPADAQVTVEISAADFFRLLVGALDPMAAFGDGRLKLEGDMMFAMQAQGMFQPA